MDQTDGFDRGVFRALAVRPESFEPPRVPAKRCPACHGAGMVRRLVDDGEQRIEYESCDCVRREIARRTVAELTARSSLGFYTRKTFETFERARPPETARPPSPEYAWRVAREFVEASEPQWLYIYGPGTGCGKTHLAAAIANDWIARGRAVLFMTAPDLFDSLRATYDRSSAVSLEQRIGTIRQAPLFVLDDLGAEYRAARGSDEDVSWADDKLYQVLDYRYRYRLPTVYTSNRALADLPSARIRSRLDDHSITTVVRILGADRRLRGRET